MRHLRIGKLPKKLIVTFLGLFFSLSELQIPFNKTTWYLSPTDLQAQEEEDWDKFSVQDIYELGLQNYRSRRYEKALELFLVAHRRIRIKRVVDPDLKLNLLFSISSTHMRLGHIPYLRYGDTVHYEEAIRFAEMTLDTKPDYWPALENLAVIYTKMDDLEKADFYYTEIKKHLKEGIPDYQRIKEKHDQVLTVLKRKREKQYQ